MTRTPLQLAALASSAVPGLDPAAVQAVAGRPGHYYEVAFVTDSQQRVWVVRAPVTPAAGAQMDTTVALLGLLGRRLPFAVPAPRGFVGVPEGRVVVYPHISGRPISLATLPPGPGLAAELGRALAAIHNLDRALFDEASLPVYDSETYRTRRLADLDRAAATGHVPTALLSRWEHALEDVSLWRFAPTPVHGDLDGDKVLVVFEDPDDVMTGRVRGITGWDDAQVADPAEDFAAIVTQCDPQTIETVLEAYANSRVERPDPQLRRRARLAAELRLLTALLTAVSAGRRDLIRAYATDLRDLDERTLNEPDDPSRPDLPYQPDRSERSDRPEESAYDREQGDEHGDMDDEGEIGGESEVGDDGEVGGNDDLDDVDEVDETGDQGDSSSDPERAEASGGADGDDLDVGEDTQPISGAHLGELTAVIPQEELDRIRRERVTDDTSDGASTGATAFVEPPDAEPAGTEPSDTETADKTDEPSDTTVGPDPEAPKPSGPGIDSDTFR